MNIEKSKNNVTQFVGYEKKNSRMSPTIGVCTETAECKFAASGQYNIV